MKDIVDNRKKDTRAMNITTNDTMREIAREIKIAETTNAEVSFISYSFVLNGVVILNLIVLVWNKHYQIL